MAEDGFSKEERDAMKARARELKAAKLKADPEGAFRDAVEELAGLDRELIDRLEAIISKAAPELVKRTMYGMPAWSTPGKTGKTVAFFKPATKFGERNASFGFQDTALIDDGNMWPSAYNLVKIGKAEEDLITALMKKAVGE